MIINIIVLLSTWTSKPLSLILHRLDLVIGDKYKMIKKIGSGAFGEIYKGKWNHKSNRINVNIGVNTKSGEEVAIKLVSIHIPDLLIGTGQD